MMKIKDKFAIDLATIRPEYHQGVRHWNNGFPYKISTDITECLSCGYGKLDEHGFWEFPFPNNLAESKDIQVENKRRHENQRKIK